MKYNTALPYFSNDDIDIIIPQLENILKGNGFFTKGPKVKEFEDDFASYCGARYAVAFSHGTAALFGAYKVAKWTPCDQLITSSISFFATIAPAIDAVAPIDFVDVDSTTGNIDLDLLEEISHKQPSRGKQLFVIPHMGGACVDMERMQSVIKDPEAIVIEDAAHALGSSYKNGARVGSCAFSDMTVFSFHPLKSITTGEGGMVTTNDEGMYQHLLRLRGNGVEKQTQSLEFPDRQSPWYYEVQEFSQNSHITEMQAALGISQLKRLDSFIGKRRELVKSYSRRFRNYFCIKMLPQTFDAKSAFHLCMVAIDFSKISITKAQLMERLKEKGISTQVHYMPLYLQPCIQKKWPLFADYELEGAKKYYDSCLSLPLFVDMEEKDVEFVCRKLKECVSRKN